MADADDVLAANEAFYSTFNRKDTQAMEALWSASDEVGCVHPGWDVLRGRQLVIDSWRNILSNPEQPRIVVGNASVTLLGDVALVHCHELVAGSPLAATNVFRREADGWKLFHHQSGPVASFDR